MPNDCCTVGSCVDCQTVRSHAPFYRQILASSMGSMIATFTLNPITVVKVRLQKANSNHLASKVSIGSTIRNIHSENGITGFWMGTRMGLIMSVPSTVLYMSVYEKLRDTFNSEPRLAAVRSVVPAIAGAMSRAVTVSIISPLELIRTIQTGGAGESITTIGSRIMQEKGFGGLYRGWFSSIMRDCPYSAIYWLSFESLRPLYMKCADTVKEINEHNNIDNGSIRRTNVDKAALSLNFTQSISFHANNNNNHSTSNNYNSNNSSSPIPSYITFLSGATAGMLAAICTHPFDVLKTQLQVGAFSNVTTNTAGSPSAPSSSAAATATAARPTLFSIYSQGGVSSLYRGLTMRLATVIPAGAIMVTIYESIKTMDL